MQKLAEEQMQHLLNPPCFQEPKNSVDYSRGKKLDGDWICLITKKLQRHSQ